MLSLRLLSRILEYIIVSIKTFAVFAAIMLLSVSCSQQAKRADVYEYPGYRVRLISFSENDRACRSGCVAWLNVTFTTQRDSVFWGSFNNMGDRYFVSVDSSDKQNFISQYVSRCTVGDSFCIMMDPATFFKQQFKSDKLPYFCENDTVVKTFAKVKAVMSQQQFEDLGLEYLNNEKEQIVAFYGNSTEAEAARTPENYYLVDPPAPFFAEEVKEGDQVTISYSGYFLSGQLLDRSASDFTYTYGAPAQVLEGLNIVIGRLNVGQTVKIILPSPLAFGEKGSSDKTVPPFTPLLYEVTLKSINKYPTP